MSSSTKNNTKGRKPNATETSRIQQAEDLKAPRDTRSAHREYSGIVLDGYDRAASRAMLHAVGFSSEDFKKSQVGIASTWNMVTPCNMHIDKLARDACSGVDAAGGKGVIFGCLGISGRHFDGHRRHEVFARIARSYRRLD
jgi:dihydroxyacid dehydratase/phosphogluconate dehydratase